MCDVTGFLKVEFNAQEPAYSQLVGQVWRQVASGRLLPGTELPSVREVARALSLSTMTVSKAYSILERDGVLRRRRGKTMTVAELGRARERDRVVAELVRPTMDRAAREALELGLTLRQARVMLGDSWLKCAEASTHAPLKTSSQRGAR